MNNNNNNVITIPANFKTNIVSPTAEKIVKIDKNGKVDFFIRCGDWGDHLDGKVSDDSKYIYYKFSFKIDGFNCYDNMQQAAKVSDFINAIKDKNIKDLTVSIVKPKKDLFNYHCVDMEPLEIKGINIKIKDILTDMENIWFGNSWSITMAKFLHKYGQKEEALKLCKEEPKKEIIEFMVDIIKKLEKNGKFKQPLKDNVKLPNEKDKEFEQQLKDKYVEIGKAGIQHLDKTLQKTLYKKKDKGFLSIFSGCTCGLDNVAEMEKGKEKILN